ncbi:WecB/TagA/CpsF family glycosyltransferase [Schaalia vaccimaxillae]|uniref:WecB/TagA/CpsF family glycosyltransferase n=1 Tax=Schaalia vaccimaxillae TaxID=183916 RepID=UPI0003B791EE|nr:WecB/TagA/CpsF family glycosyltransferase [Schaalia vaccimaxillae]
MYLQEHAQADGEGVGDEQSRAAQIVALQRFAELALEPGRVTTWLNHWSLLHADWEQLAKMDLIGFDGTLLQMALNGRGHRLYRSSADLVLPYLFDKLPNGSRIAFIGAAPGVAQKAAQRLEGFEILAIDGYEGVKQLRRDPCELIAFDPDFVVVGLGAGLQELVASKVHGWLPQACVCTAGGWLDQFAQAEQYFPEWIHRYRLGWAWRIAHEPRRLIGRYTVEAVDFVALKGRLLERLESLGVFTDLGLIVESSPKG